MFSLHYWVTIPVDKNHTKYSPVCAENRDFETEIMRISINTCYLADFIAIRWKTMPLSEFGDLKFERESTFEQVIMNLYHDEGILSKFWIDFTRFNKVRLII